MRALRAPTDEVPGPSGSGSPTFSTASSRSLRCPIAVIMSVGVIGIVGAMIAAIVVFVAWLNSAIPVQGYTALMLVSLLSTGAILLSLGIVGMYVWRAYENTKGRPSAVVMSRESFTP